MKDVIGIGIVALLVLALAAGGYAIGTANAPTSGEADDVRSAAETEAAAEAEQAAFAESNDSGRQAGEAQGRNQGVSAGAAAAEESLTPAAPPLVQLPNGELGYALPEDQRSLSCVGVEAATGQCVGD